MSDWEDTRFLKIHSGDGRIITYTNGPAIVGQYPSPEYRYSGQWAVYLDSVASVVRARPIEHFDTRIDTTETGTMLANFSAAELTHVAELSAAFDNSGQFILGIQDGSTNPPTIQISANNGDYRASWAGYQPVVFNAVEAFTGYYPTGSFYHVTTGAVGCIYTNEARDALYARYMADGFSREYEFNLAGTTGHFVWLAGMSPALFTRGQIPVRPIELYEWDIEDAVMQVGWDVVAFEEAGRTLSGVMAQA